MRHLVRTLQPDERSESANVARTARSPSPHFRIHSDCEPASPPIPRNVDNALDSGSMSLSCYPLRRCDVHGIKSLPSALDVKTDRIYHTVGSDKRIGSRTLVVNVGPDRLKLRIVKTEQPMPPILMP
jgi:hypothetical protein